MRSLIKLNYLDKHTTKKGGTGKRTLDRFLDVGFQWTWGPFTPFLFLVMNQSDTVMKSSR
jgi:hypothetical protein